MLSWPMNLPVILFLLCLWLLCPWLDSLRVLLVFQLVLDGITAMFPELRDILSISNVLTKSEIWKAFLQQINYKPRLRQRSWALDKNELYEATAPLIDTPESWDTFDDSSNLLSVRKFSKSVLVPHIATTLISQDQECTFAHTMNILEDSRRCGEILYPNQPEEKVDVIVTPKNDEPSEPLRFRKKPVVQTKKTPKAKNKPKPKKDPEEPKPTHKQAEPRKLRTRSGNPDEWSIISFPPLSRYLYASQICASTF
ncbi:hypothetical protein B0H13DRAFT_1867658 [Mycena leptocephala]|nr:hypothetical protein B0H13DRAFT_1867658 [Mycena leptocephala]